MAAFIPVPAGALFVTVMAFLAACISAQAPYTLPPLPYAFKALEPLIDTRTMTLHHNRHHNASVTSLNAALRQCPPAIANLPLTTLLHQLGSSFFTKTLPANVSTALRNSGGSHFNHAAFWKVLRPPTTNPRKHPNICSPALNHAIHHAFGNLSALNATFSTAASRLFGSGWTWLCCFPNKTLAVVSTPNQDNPLMSHLVLPAQRCTPILGIDVWEHAYYLKHQNLRNNYIAAFWKLINWPRVSTNYANAVKGRLGALWK